MRRSFLILTALLASTALAGTKVTLDDNGVLEIDGKKTFVISFSIPPPPGGKTPDGKDAFAELADAGTNFMRIRPTTGPQDYTESGIRTIKAWLDEAASHHMYCWITLGHLPAIDAKKPDNEKNEKLLRMAIEMYRDHPALAVWKGYDEPAWVKMPAEPLVRAYKIFKELDPNHPVIIIQAPMKASLPLEPYGAACDIMGIDIYPLTYPPGKHSDFGNHEISLVSDCTKWIVAAAAPKHRAVWMTLQIAWAGTATPGKVLRFPTFPEQRYMTYAAIINGARGVNYQGGERPLSLTERDASLGWNWTYWSHVMRPLVEELGEKSPLHPALIAPNSRLPIKVEGKGSADIEFCVRESANDIYILAAKRESETAKVKFIGLPTTTHDGVVLFEEPRKIEAKAGAFEDWFAPNDVHIYRLKQ